MSDLYVTAPGVSALEHPNVTLLKDGYTAFAKGDMELIRGLLADDVVHRVPGRGPICGGVPDARGGPRLLRPAVRAVRRDVPRRALLGDGR
ncbi:hypothetical protein [Actinomadura madurae]|uniref:hypothetical protein n=1 Tax=Actinomadura madurae TaxID=1993 RepID=UPI0020D20CEC|nr:hypothetical protein [Actinomadura madurae]MCQ0016131.1 hypothetical protein [Actinomadura madurae]